VAAPLAARDAASAQPHVTLLARLGMTGGGPYMRAPLSDGS